MKKFSVVKKMLSGVGVVGMMTAGSACGSVFADGGADNSTFTYFKAAGKCAAVNDANNNFVKFECDNNGKKADLKISDLGIESSTTCGNPNTYTNMGWLSLSGVVTLLLGVGAAVGAAVMNFVSGK